MKYTTKRKLKTCPLCNRNHYQKTKACMICNKSAKDVYLELFGEPNKKVPLHLLVWVKNNFPNENVFEYVRKNKEDFRIIPKGKDGVDNE